MVLQTVQVFAKFQLWEVKKYRWQQTPPPHPQPADIILSLSLLLASSLARLCSMSVWVCFYVCSAPGYCLCLFLMGTALKISPCPCDDDGCVLEDALFEACKRYVRHLQYLEDCLTYSPTWTHVSVNCLTLQSILYGYFVHNLSGRNHVYGKWRRRRRWGDKWKWRGGQR